MLVRTDLFGVGPGTFGGLVCWVVFGTLLGPEATGPGRALGVLVGTLFLVSLLHRSCTECVWGVWCGVVV